jgi:DNA repair protein RecO (recombination protein O)
LAAEKALSLVIRVTDWSETSRIATLWTRELGKVRVLAKGGRRLKSNFESGLDLLTVCSIVLLRKSSGGLDLLTEAQVVRRFPRLSGELAALYSAYYIAELLSEWTEDYDPHPVLFDEAVAALAALGEPEVPTGPRLMRFEMVLLRELGYSPILDRCVTCELPPGERGLAFTAAGGGVLCPACQSRQRERRTLSAAAWRALRLLDEPGDAWQTLSDAGVRAEVRQVLNHYVTYLLGRRPRLLPYLGG